MSEITTPINMNFRTDPITMEIGRPAFSPNLSFKRATQIARIALPTIMQGIMIGIALMRGFPVMINAVIGVIIDRMIAHGRPAVRTHIIRHAFMMGPVMYTDRFLKNWLAMQIARRIAAYASDLVLNFFMIVDSFL